jgi:hypothetical protein
MGDGATDTSPEGQIWGAPAEAAAQASENSLFSIVITDEGRG